MFPNLIHRTDLEQLVDVQIELFVMSLKKEIAYLKMTACPWTRSELAARTRPKFSASSAVLGPAASFYELNRTSSIHSTGSSLLYFPSALWSFYGTTKRGTRDKDCLKKNDKHKAYKIFALCCTCEAV